MKITSVALKDVKSYNDTAPIIRFQTGVNAIIGENGSGKSTLCEAIGFALFDYLHPYSQADFVRDGRKSGKVMVTFQSDSDGRHYQVERGVNQSRFDVFDADTDTRLQLNGKEEVVLWLKEQLGVPGMMNLQTLWKSSIGVSQGKFTNDFSETPSVRAELFNPLLEVDVYRRLWRDMKGVIDVLRHKKSQMSEQIARLESTVEDLPVLQKQTKEIADHIQKTKQTLSQITQRIKIDEQKKTRLETIQKQIQKLTNSLHLHQEKQKNLLAQLKQAKKQLAEAEKAERLVKMHAGGYQQYVMYSKQLDELHQKKKIKDALEKQSMHLNKQQMSLQQELKQYQEDVSIAKKSKEQMKTLEAKVKEQQQLEQKLDDIKQKEKELNQTQKQQKQVKQKISQLRKEFSTINRQIDTIRSMKKTAQQHTQLQTKKDSLLQKQSIATHQQDEQQKAIDLLNKHEKSACPTCSRPLNIKQKKEIIFQKKQEIAQAQQTQQQVKNDLRHITKQLQEAAKAEQELQRLDDLQTMCTSFQKDAEEQKNHKEKLDAHAASLEEEIRKKQELITKLDELKDPKKKFQQANTRYDDHCGKEEKLKTVEQKLTQLKERQNQLSSKLGTYDSVQEKIDSIKVQQKQLQQPYETYLQYKDAAGKQAQQEKMVHRFQSSVETIEQQISNETTQLKDKKKQFDKNTFETIKKTLDEQKQKQVQKQTQIDEWLKQKTELDCRIHDKKKTKKQLMQNQKDYRFLGKDIEFAQFLRETFQQTRPLITEILVEEISREADRIYRQLRGVPSEELAWTRDYEVVIHDGGNERAFHKLSGGEQMCAALAVRLAILKLLSKMDVVFLDEPTMNLDENKKDNLVSQLQELSGFSQIFVISHDETFESMTEHVITLEKKQGATRLLQQFQSAGFELIV